MCLMFVSCQTLWEPALLTLTGLDAPIHSFLEKHSEVLELKQQIQGFVEQWLPMLEKNNRSYLTVRDLVVPVANIARVYLTKNW